MKERSLHFGANIGHWLSQSPLDRNEMACFFTRDDVAWLRDIGMDHIRLPVDCALFETEGSRNKYSEEGLGWIDRALDWCTKAGMGLVLDMHFLPGHTFHADYRDYNLIWNSASPQRRRAVDLWRMLARRYRGTGALLELLNEPIAPEDAQWNELARALHAAIREEDGEATILITSNNWSSPARFPALQVLDDPRIIYTFHFYQPHPFTHQNARWDFLGSSLAGRTVPYPGPLDPALLDAAPALRHDFAFMAERPYGQDYLEAQLRPVLDFAAAHDASIYCGEYGTISTAPTEDRLRWYRDLLKVFSRHGIGSAVWNYKSDNFGMRTRDGEINRALVEALSEGAGKSRS